MRLVNKKTKMKAMKEKYYCNHRHYYYYYYYYYYSLLHMLFKLIHLKQTVFPRYTLSQ